MSDTIMRCNDCRVCCQLEHFIVNLYETEDLSQYRTYKRGSEYYVSKSRSGACVYLGPHGCTIYDRRPLVCSEFTCFKFIYQDWSHYCTEAHIEIIIPLQEAARALRQRHRISYAQRFNRLLNGQSAT